MKAISLFAVACCMLSSCGIIHKTKTSHKVTSDSLSRFEATAITETHITEHASGTVPYQVATLSIPLQPCSDTIPLNYETKDYTATITPPHDGYPGQIYINGKTASVPVVIDKTTDIKDHTTQKAATSISKTVKDDSKNKSTNTIPVWILILIAVAIAAFALYKWYNRGRRP